MRVRFLPIGCSLLTLAGCAASEPAETQQSQGDRVGVIIGTDETYVNGRIYKDAQQASPNAQRGVVVPPGTTEQSGNEVRENPGGNNQSVDGVGEERTINPNMNTVNQPSAFLDDGDGYDFAYDSCEQARAAGDAPLYEGSPGYNLALDRDGDGVACE